MSQRSTSHDIALRVATPADIPALFAVRTSVRQNHLDRAQLAERGVTPASIAGMLAGGDARARVVEAPPAASGGDGEDRNVVGFSMADARLGTVFALFVRPEAEGRGHGRALLAAAEAWLFDAGWETIWLQTGKEPEIRAHRVYRAAGWELVGPADHEDVRYEKRRGAGPTAPTT